MKCLLMYINVYVARSIDCAEIMEELGSWKSYPTDVS